MKLWCVLSLSGILWASLADSVYAAEENLASKIQFFNQLNNLPQPLNNQNRVIDKFECHLPVTQGRDRQKATLDIAKKFMSQNPQIGLLALEAQKQQAKRNPLLMDPVINEVKLSTDYDGPCQLLIDSGFANNHIIYDPDTIVTNIAQSSGTFTDFLYDVVISEKSASDNKPHHVIIKGVSNSQVMNRHHQTAVSELQSYAYLRQSEIGQLNNENNPNLPVLGLDWGSFWYFKPFSLSTPSTTIKQYFSILPKVSGQEAFKHLENENCQPTPILCKMFENIGRSLGTFHYRLTKNEVKTAIGQGKFDKFLTTNHHDFYVNNIMYDKDTEKVSLIDLATMAETHRNNVPFWHDIFMFYTRLKYQTWPHNQLSTVNDMMKLFVKGYSEALPIHVRDAFKTYTYQLIHDWSETFKRYLKLPEYLFQPYGIDMHNPDFFSQLIISIEQESGQLTDVKLNNFLGDEFPLH